MKLVDISKEDVKVGDIAVIENFKDDVFYSEITKISKETGPLTDTPYTKITTKAGYSFALETGKQCGSIYHCIIGYKRYDNEAIKAKQEIKNLRNNHTKCMNKVADDLTQIIKKYLQDNNIDGIAFAFSTYSKECVIHVMDNSTQKLINNLETQYNSNIGMELD